MNATSDLPKQLEASEREMMLHATGHKPGGGRNHYVAGNDSHEAHVWRGLVRLGLANEGKHINDGRDAVFSVAVAGYIALYGTTIASRLTAGDLIEAKQQIAEWEQLRARGCARAGVVMDSAVWRQALVETQAMRNAAARERDEARRLACLSRSEYPNDWDDTQHCENAWKEAADLYDDEVADALFPGARP